MAEPAASTYPEELRDAVERYLESLRFSDDTVTGRLEDAMRYSLLAGGSASGPFSHSPQRVPRAWTRTRCSRLPRPSS